MSRFKLPMSGLAALAFVAGGCGDGKPDGPLSAVAVIQPTQGHDARGTVRFETTDEGVHVIADLEKLQPGTHAFHVHEVGSCDEEAAAAGPHFDFLAVSDQESRRITGDLGDLEVDASGQVRLETTSRQARLTGERSITGRSVVIHERGNDANSPPDGDAGSRIACGVIEAADGRKVAAAR